jgi:5-methylcytosine-specific restriction endonuclease McrA
MIRREVRRMKKLLPVLAFVLLLIPLAPARTTSSGHARSTPKARTATAKSRSVGSHTRAMKCTTCTRSSNGRIKRSRAATDAFRRSQPCPSTGKASGACPGYVIDHVVPLKRGGADAPSNMQWQTKAAAKAKDKIE